MIQGINARRSLYLSKLFDPEKLFSTVVRIHQYLEKLQKKKKFAFDAIAFSGNSGAGVAYPLSAMFGYNVLCVRKEHEKSHGDLIEGPCGIIKTYVILDDQIDTGKTVQRILDAIGPNAKCVAVLTYDLDMRTSDDRLFDVPFFFIPHS